ncbi:LysR family transcriptional regulator [Puniceibacterium sp. IMCC21224]|uniref:LysR family transcriptional regulator n=1 Tax=Puniceibacterium sp. IMCC21224 TaxID=1618204 RepID=UPI00064E10D1|nr:LysR family transcriptional regulator [Puniceibacterium sp. IMCC21224]KMK65914.1 transcriptional regulator [Puniceibacterium sp. IMCC21224]
MSLSERHLRAFVAVARYGSVTRAASALNMTQPGVTQAIKTLEQIVSVVLFDRSPKGVSLTRAGRDFLKTAERLAEELERAVTNLQSAATMDHGHVTVAGVPSITSGFLPMMVAEFQSAHPGIKVLIYDGMASTIADMVRDGTCDLGLTSLAPGEHDLATDPMAEDDLIMLCPRGHPLSLSSAVDWAALAQYPFIAVTRQSPVRRLIEDGFVRAGQVMSAEYEVGHITTIGAMVAEGLGLSVIPRLSLSLVQSRDLIGRPLTPRAFRALDLVRLPARALSPAAQAFRDHLVANRDRLTPHRPVKVNQRPVQFPGIRRP